MKQINININTTHGCQTNRAIETGSVSIHLMSCIAALPHHRLHSLPLSRHLCRVSISFHNTHVSCLSCVCIVVCVYLCFVCASLCFFVLCLCFCILVYVTIVAMILHIIATGCCFYHHHCLFVCFFSSSHFFCSFFFMSCVVTLCICVYTMLYIYIYISNNMIYAFTYQHF